jgi:hypothetical protein
MLIALVLFVPGLEPCLQCQAETGSGGIDPQHSQAAASLVGPAVRISEPTWPEAERYKPAIAYNWRHHEYLVVWHNKWPGSHRDIYARRVSESGQLLSSFAVTAGPNDRLQPAVAYNGVEDEYLVTWMYNANGDGSTYDIWGRLVAWDGSSMAPEFEIISWPNRTFWTPSVAWNSYRNQYLVVWSALNPATMVPTDVADALLAADGTKLYGTIISTADDPHQPDVTYNLAADEFLVVWRRLRTPADGDIVGARVSAGGRVVNPPGVFEISAVTEDQMLPAVTTNQQDRYLVVWQQLYEDLYPDWDIYGQELNVNGDGMGFELHLGKLNDDETSPAVAARPGPTRQYVCVWQRTSPSGEEIRAVHLEWDRAYFEIAAWAFWSNSTPAVAAGQPSFLIAFEGDSPDPNVQRHIYGARWVPHTVFLPLVIRNR